jgi:hypothetical protein
LARILVTILEGFFFNGRNKMAVNSIRSAVVFYCVALVSDVACGALPKLICETAKSADGHYILVSIPDIPIEEELAQADDRHTPSTIREIRATYPMSGMYLNDGSAKLLWPDDGRWFGAPIIAPDGEHVIYEGNWAAGDQYGWRAVAFARKGVVIREYFDNDIISRPLLKFVLNGCDPPRCSKTAFNPQGMTYAIETNQGEIFVFDVTTGTIIDSYSPFPMLYGSAGLVFLVSATFGTAWWYKRRVRSRRLL